MNDLKAVVAAQEYIRTHHDDNEFSVEMVCSEVGYSRRQLDRFFEKHMGITLYEYINAVVLSESAEKLLNEDNSVIDVALDSHYQSHEGYTRSFAKRFSVTPNEYRKHRIAIPIFTQYPANHYYILKEGQAMDTTTICTVTPMNRPKRKLIYLTSNSATDYLSYCEEVGCDWEGLLNSIHEKFDTAALIDLPGFLQEESKGKSDIQNAFLIHYMREVKQMNMLKQLNAAIEYIETNLYAECDLDTAAGIACVTADSFIRFFSYMTGMTLTEYVRRRRLTLAAQDLQHSKTPIVDIAMKYGYDSATTFSRAFTKQHGITPSVYRKIGGSLKVYPPASFHIMIKGAKEMDFRIIELGDTFVYGVSKQYEDQGYKTREELRHSMWADDCDDVPGYLCEGRWNQPGYLVRSD